MRLALGLGLTMAIGGCIGSDFGTATRNTFSAVGPKAALDEQTDQAPAVIRSALADGAGGTGDDADSVIIDGLLARQSVLTAGSSFDQVADAVLAANSRAAEAELRSARLRADAASKNWLPTIGPNVSLTSLGDVVAGMVIDQVLFSNGRKKAERQFAKADVEVAAVGLAEDTNDRVLSALDLYITAEEAREKERANEAVLARLDRFAYVMEKRVQGGVSDPADLQVVRQKLAEVAASRASDAQTAATAIAELNAMSLTPLDDLRGMAKTHPPSAAAKSLSVLKAEAERDRAVADATIARSGFLPGVSAKVGVSDSGTDGVISVGAENGIGFGTGASLKAIEATRDAAGRKVDQADEDSARALRRLEQQLVAVQQQAAHAARLLEQANANLDLFDRQYRAGVRPVMEVVSVYETKARVEREQIGYSYQVALVELKIARILGVLVDGADI